jgi:NodT family efflux transporter outer membrane factor (OMF) lipoprotein
MPVRSSIGIIWLTVLILLPAGCAVGPDFQPPKAPKTDSRLPQPLIADGESQQWVKGGDIPARWWQLFHSPALNVLVRRAIEHNPDLQAAEASLRQARENVAAAGGRLLPEIDAAAGARRQKVSFAQFGQPGNGSSRYTLYNASVDVSYGIDLFGGTRRQIELLQAEADLRHEQLEAAWLTVTANVVTAALQEASLRARIDATRAMIAADEAQLKMLRRQLELGGASRSDLLAGEARLADTRAALPELKKQLALIRNQLAALTGRIAGSDDTDERFDLSALQLPGELPLSLPSSLVAQRPDIRAAEARLHAASAEVGVATANMLPQLTLTGSYGTVGTQPGQLFTADSMIWNMGAGLVQPLFRGGELQHRRKAAIAAFDEAAARYRSTVLAAFRNVADVLRVLESDTETLAARDAARQAAQRSRDLAQRQFRVGAISYLARLDAERVYQQARIAFVQARADRYADTAALFQALGGGWWNRDKAVEKQP